MAYDLQALVADEGVIKMAVPRGAVIVALPQGKAMIPLSQRIQDAYHVPSLPLTLGKQFPESIAILAEAIARSGKVAYIEADFFGGLGTQACVTWDSSGQRSDPLVDQNAINTALKFLGVAKGDYFDEFNALGLEKHRETEDWVKVVSVSPSESLAGRNRSGRRRRD